MKPEPCLRGGGRVVLGCRRNRARVGLPQLPVRRRRTLARLRSGSVERRRYCDV